jgi:hypothetical protein
VPSSQLNWSEWEGQTSVFAMDYLPRRLRWIFFKDIFVKGLWNDWYPVSDRNYRYVAAGRKCRPCRPKKANGASSHWSSSALPRSLLAACSKRRKKKVVSSTWYRWYNNAQGSSLADHTSCRTAEELFFFGNHKIQVLSHILI